MKTFKININDELVNYLEKLSYEVNARERIVKTMLADTAYTDLMKNENFIKYQQRYELSFFEYELAKQEIQELIPEHLRAKHQLAWNIDFRTSILWITFNCNCFDNLESWDEVVKE